MQRSLSLAVAIALVTAGSQARAQFAAQVVVGPVVRQTVQSGQTYVGTVKPLRTALVGSAVDGRVEEFPLNEGDRVQKGQTLAQLRTRQLELQKVEAEGDVAALKAQLDLQENGTRPELIDEARARVEAQQALVEYAEARLKRYEMLRSSRTITAEEYEESLMQRESSLKTLAATRALLIVAEKGPRIEEITETRGKLAAAQARVDQLQDRIDRHTMVSPFNGYLVEEHTEVGEWRTMGQPIARVVEIDQVDVEVLVPERVITAVRLGDTARVELPALPNLSLEGTVQMVVPQADSRSRSFPVKVRVDNQFVDGRPILGPGMFARVTLSLGAEENALMVPKDAVVLGGRVPRVFVFQPAAGKADDGNVRGVDVDLGVAAAGMIQIKGNLQPNELVIIEGNERLLDGQPAHVLDRRAAGQGGRRPVEPAATRP